MATNDFQPFATGPGANVMSQADYLALAALLTGFQAGKASSAQINKALRQSSTIGALIGQFIANANIDALDNGDITSLVTKFTNALNANLNLKTAAQRDVGDISNKIPDMSYFVGIREGKGYQRIPGGMIMQWGRVNVVTANTSADVIIDQFKIPFPGAALQCFATVRQTQVNLPSFACAEAINPNEIRVQAVAIDITNKTITQGQIVPVCWYAIGY